MNLFESEIFRLFVVGIGFVLIFLCAEIWHLTAHPPVEWTRKFIHIASGIIIACFHWTFKSNRPVFLLCAALALAMFISRRYNWFKLIYGVKRSSFGDYYFLASIAILFPISHQHPLFYFIAILNLTISDALAAILGSEQEKKSLQGSAFFFLSSLFIVSIPLYLNGTEPLPLLFTAFVAASVGTIIEALCYHGFDNLLVPLAVYLILIFFSTGLFGMVKEAKPISTPANIMMIPQNSYEEGMSHAAM